MIRLQMNRWLSAICLLLVLGSHSFTSAKTSVTVLDFGQTELAKTVAEKVRSSLRAKREFLVADGDLSRSAAMGVGYKGSLNLTVNDARDLGAALATEFYLLGDAQILRRSSSTRSVYYESYCSFFLVNSRTGNLLVWERPVFDGDEATGVLQTLYHHVEHELTPRLVVALRRAAEDEQLQRTAIVSYAGPVIEEAPEDEKTAEAQGLRLPRPFKRLRPEYPASAERAEAEGTVDVLVEVGADGEVGGVHIVRWAGFGLDEATVTTVKQMHFFPAMRNGTAIPMRVLLRYNFRKPSR
ncbi:MAG: energy transducer TonB [Acidobacteria bacterium]|nr:energy transducer TonB [Acidobacteriota bacterium]MCA1627244.1 energy transducer TonB [Acidobacteriota bacterium]